MDQTQLSNLNVKRPLAVECLQTAEASTTEAENSKSTIMLSRVESEVEDAKNNRSKVHLTPVIVDQKSAVPLKGEAPHSFEFHHEDLPESTNQSIFEVRHHLFSFGNERPENHHIISQREEVHSRTPHKVSGKTTQGSKFLPQLVEGNKENSHDKNLPSEKDLTRTSKTKRKNKKSRQLYDYNNPSYLERSRRTRRRKQSEVDIEVGLRLSRFIQQPYEGCVDKYSKKYQQRFSRDRRARSKGSHSANSSADSSPLSSSTEQINSPRLSRLRDYDDEQLRSYLWCRRGTRRRSISASPPRLRASNNFDFRNTQSQSASPSLSPAPSAGPSSPAVSRYRKTTFATILNSAKKREEFESRLDHRELGLLPDIHQRVHRDSPLVLTNCDETFFSRSLPNTEAASSQFRTRSGTFSDFRNHQSNEASNMSKSEYLPSKKGKTIPIPAPPPPGPSPSSLRKHVLVNSNVPSGSPTFQRTVQGLHVPSDSSGSAGDKSSAEVRRKPASPKSQPQQQPRMQPPQQPRVRIVSVGGKQKILKRSPTSACGTRPNIAGHHVSFGACKVEIVEPAAENCYDDDSDDDEIIEEMRDRLTSLKTNDTPPMMPSKSILKNRRRSIDDLDVGTKKGLAMYLKSKQKAAQFKRRNGL